MNPPLRRIAISTGGGDAPGLNAVIRATVSAASHRGWECVGIRDGFNGLLQPERYPQGGLVPLTHERVRGISHLGGTILGTTNKGDPFHFPTRQPDGSMGESDRSDDLLACFAREGIDALVSVGGDGTLSIAHELHRKGLRVVGVPKTINNDLDKTFTTFGFDTAVTFATECLDRLHSTAESHQRIMVVEMMGRYAGWISLHAGIAGGAHAILIPEIPFDLEPVVAKVQGARCAGPLIFPCGRGRGRLSARRPARRAGVGRGRACGAPGGHGRAGGAGVGPPHRQGCPGRGAGASAARRQPNGL